jgi:hypothetical protein
MLLHDVGLDMLLHEDSITALRSNCRCHLFPILQEDAELAELQASFNPALVLVSLALIQDRAHVTIVRQKA